MAEWWSMRPGPEREAAKAAYYTNWPEVVPRGTARKVKLSDGQSAFAGSGGVWPFTDRATKRLAITAAQSGVIPDPRLTIVRANGRFVARGKRGEYALYTDCVVTFRASYRAASDCERTLANREFTTLVLPQGGTEPAESGNQE